MSNLKGLDLILKTVKEHNITAYEIGKNTNLSTYAVQKILKGETKNPNGRTISTILDFLETTIIGTDVKIDKVEEPTEKYTVNNKDELYERHIKLMEEHKDLLMEYARLIRILEKNGISY